MGYGRHLAAAALTALTAVPAGAVELVMVEQRGCSYCAMWDAQIAPAYPKTAEGRAAPLRRVDLHAPLPADLSLERRVVFTPTFVLVDDGGAELGRIEGYPGDQFFWGVLGALLDRADVPVERP